MDTKLFRETLDVFTSYIKYKHCSLIDCDKVTQLNISYNFLNDEMLNKYKNSKNIHKDILNTLTNFIEWDACTVVLHIIEVVSLYYFNIGKDIIELVTLAASALMEHNYNWMVNNNGWDGFIKFLNDN
ncbi:hypothetical protein [Hypsugopox virus]|nr:hypothetical protein [Hypsugopox virus]